MVSSREAAAIVVGSFAGKLADRGIMEVDTYMGTSAATWSARYRTYLTPGLGAVLAYVGYKGWKVRSPNTQLGLVAMGSNMLTQTVETAEEAITTGAFGFARPVYAAAGGVPATVSRGTYALAR